MFFREDKEIYWTMRSSLSLPKIKTSLLKGAVYEKRFFLLSWNRILAATFPGPGCHHKKPPDLFHAKELLFPELFASTARIYSK
jgi:hypothetical protein